MDFFLLFAMLATAMAAAGGPKFTEADCCNAEFAFWEAEKKKRSGVLSGVFGGASGGASGVLCGGAGGAGGAGGGAGGEPRVVDLNQIYSLSLPQYNALKSECDNIGDHLGILIRYSGFNSVHVQWRKYDRTRALICDAGSISKPFFTGPFYEKESDTVPVQVLIPGNSYYLDDGTPVFLQVSAPYEKDRLDFVANSKAAEEIVLAFLRKWDLMEDPEFDEYCDELKCIAEISLSDDQLDTLSVDGADAVKAGKLCVTRDTFSQFKTQGSPAFIDQYRRFTRAFVRLSKETETPNSKLYLKELLAELVRMHKK